MSTRSSQGEERGSELLSLRKAVLRTKNSKRGLSSFGSHVRRTTLGSERNSFPRVLAALTVGLLSAALPAGAKPKAAAVQTATIENTGSTNTLGYRITVSSDRSAKIAMDVEDHPATMSWSAGKFRDTSKLFKDLEAAMPLSSLPVGHGMHSVSFGTRTFITYKGQKSPDLTFASDPRTAALKADIDQITKYYVGNAPRHPIVIHADR